MTDISIINCLLANCINNIFFRIVRTFYIDISLILVHYKILLIHEDYKFVYETLKINKTGLLIFFCASAHCLLESSLYWFKSSNNCMKETRFLSKAKGMTMICSQLSKKIETFLHFQLRKYFFAVNLYKYISIHIPTTR